MTILLCGLFFAAFIFWPLFQFLWRAIPRAILRVRDAYRNTVQLAAYYADQRAFLAEQAARQRQDPPGRGRFW
jgi:hypothetical protein